MTELPINQVVTGDCREVMDEWPEDCIDFVMFSPPYWGLRDYGEEAKSVWGGDEDCDHIWGDEIPAAGSRTNDNSNQPKKEVFERRDEWESSNFCQKCGAWRGQLGLEPDYRMYVQHLVEVGREIKRILKPSGSWYLNLGDTYYSGKGQSAYAWSTRHVEERIENNETLQKDHHQIVGMGETRPQDRPQGNIKQKCKMLMPYRVALALVDDGWICRNDIIWLKPNPMPSSVKDRLNTTTERIFHFVKEKQYYYDLDAIREPHKQESKERDKYSYNSALGVRAQMPDEEREDVTPEESALNPEGKNPGDVIKTKWSSVPNQPTQGNFGHGGTHGNLFNHPKGKNPGDVIEQTTEPFPEAHFAVYPPDLCEKPIKSSCPPKVCAECGEPYERMTETVEDENAKIPERWGANSKGEYHGMGKKDEKGKAQAPSNLKRNIIESRKKEVKFKGWKKTCGCSINETRPGIVLDPMCGAGSTLIKAKQLGRRYIGIEISDEYAEIARERLEKGDEKYKCRKRKERRLEKQAKDSKKLEAFY